MLPVAGLSSTAASVVLLQRHQEGSGAAHGSIPGAASTAPPGPRHPATREPWPRSRINSLFSRRPEVVVINGKWAAVDPGDQGVHRGAAEFGELAAADSLGLSAYNGEDPVIA
jgi:hypothetical protein